jgi:ubiquinone/menaquinone biosynthesis C-methylase UbiE
VADQEISMFRKIWSLGNYQKLAAEHQVISEHLVAEAGVRAGQKVLDLACGTGNTAVAAARRRARVTASDVVPEVLEVTRRRIAAEELDEIEYHVGDSSPTIGFGDDAFDTVLSSLGASFFPNHQQVIDELLRVTRPGGTIGIALWSQASMPSEVFKAGQVVKEGATESDRIPPAYQLCNGDYLRTLLRNRAASVRIVAGNFESCFETLDDYLDAHFNYHPPAILRLTAYSDEEKAEYRRMLGGIAQRYNRATDGTVAVCMDYTILVFIKA